ncbi:DUF4129 domain-containing protein [Nocardioides marmoribigeumensis]|uniref:Protein-glutamine gamma-glutamyltransferase-like C-terminal domain-containing protein n=1 Tax=Nocardioides marmoribigeumensis TaxID=433649 RepID=A0ABU2BX28_9ACTN|nr:DUF4129 domain-containing protein [Nocardioides marmoribigeumensis]MDR7362947.1 hypothetical protein [Nocardioides marmoribigeumensis]
MSGLDPSPDQAREWVTRELARPEYPHPSLLDRFLSWLGDRLDGLVSAAGGSGVGVLVAVVVAGVLAVVLLAALSRVRRDPVATGGEAGVLDLPETADGLRRRAELSLADGRPGDAVADAARALARRCVERGLIDDSPGRTTHEVYAEVAARFTDRSSRLMGAADLFDRVVYGRRAAGADAARDLLDLEDELRRTRPGAAGPVDGLAVPR